MRKVAQPHKPAAPRTPHQHGRSGTAAMTVDAKRQAKPKRSKEKADNYDWRAAAADVDMDAVRKNRPGQRER